MCALHVLRLLLSRNNSGESLCSLDREGLYQSLPKHSRCPNYNNLWVCNFVLSRDREPQLEIQAVADCRGPEEGIRVRCSASGGGVCASAAIQLPPSQLKRYIQTGEHFISHIIFHGKVLDPKRCLEPSPYFTAPLVIALRLPAAPPGSGPPAMAKARH